MAFAARRLLTFSSVVFLGIGLAYLIAPAPMLAVVGIGAERTSDFLMRTEGVALLSGGIFIWAARSAGTGPIVLVLMGLAIYFILGSAVDLGAYLQGIVGSAAVPSVIVRTVVGIACAFVGWRLRADSSKSP